MNCSPFWQSFRKRVTKSWATGADTVYRLPAFHYTRAAGKKTTKRVICRSGPHAVGRRVHLATGSSLTFPEPAKIPITSSPQPLTGRVAEGEKRYFGGVVLTAAPQMPQNFVVSEIGAPQMPQNFPDGGAAGAGPGAGAGAGAAAATTGVPQMPQNFSSPLTGLPQEAQI